MPPQCCRCNGNGRCRGCVCVRGGRTCTSCTPSRNGRCENLSTSTDRARSTTELELSTRPTQQFIASHAINGTGRTNTEKQPPPPSNGSVGQECTGTAASPDLQDTCQEKTQASCTHCQVSPLFLHQISNGVRSMVNILCR